MKKTIIILGAFLLFTINLTAQVYSNSALQTNITDSNAFLDASSNFNHSANGSHSLGKGLVFPDTDLTQFEFDLTLADGIYFPSYFDGMVVYNSGNGVTRTGGNNPIAASTVTPGFYYFSNPEGYTNASISEGVWLPLGGGGKVDVTTSETTTNNMVAGAQIYAIKGEFVASGTSTSVTIGPHAGVGSMYAITIYRAGSNSVYSRELYSYNVATGAAITGSPHISVVYPAGTYQYVLEYLR